MPAPLTDEGLSEVIGFILILGIIAAVASLYITYVVPAQGRELEIKHMAQVNDQFLQYKTTIDSLWINGQKNVPISNTFTLGTVTGLTQGAIVVPVFQPYPSSGMIVVNERGDTLTIAGDFLRDAPGPAFPSIIKPVHYKPGHIYIKMMTTNTSKYGGLILKPQNGNWTIWLNVSSMQNPQTAFHGSVPPFPIPNPGQSSISWNELRNWITNNLNNPTGWISQLNSTITSTSTSTPVITMTMMKNDYKVFSDLIVVKNIQNNDWYTIDILDDAYGLQNELSVPFDLIEPLNSTSNWIQYQYPGQVGFEAITINSIHPMDSLEFRSSNNYWIQQDYYYQMGGVFLRQPDGMVSKVIPLISVTNKTGLPTVRMVDIFIDGSGNIGGSSPVQVVSTLTSLQENTIDQQKLATGIPNARNVTFIISAQDQQTAQMWNQTFSRIRQAALSEDFPPAWIPAPVQTGNTVQFTVRDPDNYSLFLDYTRVNLSVNLQTVAL
ncbi:MAG TPA: hypothetical protein PK445_10565 [Methanolinea sp.]|nr:hypothetical protein [Methanolinea sp.]